MIKRIARVGNSQVLIFDAALQELTGLKAGDEVNVTIHEGGAIVIAPMRPVIGAAEARGKARKLIRRNSALFKRLARKTGKYVPAPVVMRKLSRRLDAVRKPRRAKTASSMRTASA